MRKCRIGTAKFFTLLLLLYRTSVNSACNESGGLPAHHGASGIPCTFGNESYV
jgi:hypothetical protein